MLRWVGLTYDLALIAVATFDAWNSKLPSGVRIERHFGGRFAVGGETEVRIEIANHTARDISLIVKDEYPPLMKLSGAREARVDVEAQTTAALVYELTPTKRGRFEFGSIAVRFLSRWRLVWYQTRVDAPVAVKVYPNMRRAREVELRALGKRSFVAARRKSQWRGEGREFESLRDYVRGDEMRHISWTATARRGRLVTRQYQMERDQTILIMLDAGRLMTARIESETKLDSAVHAALALMSAAARAGDNAGLLVFGRRVKAFLPPKRGAEHLDAALEALHAIEPEMIEPSYARAFEFAAANSRRRSLVVVLTDLVDEEGSRELLTSLNLLRPRHLPLPRRPAAAARPLPPVDPQEKRQDRHPHPDRRPARRLRPLVRQPPPPARAHRRARGTQPRHRRGRPPLEPLARPSQRKHGRRAPQNRNDSLQIAWAARA